MPMHLQIEKVVHGGYGLVRTPERGVVFVQGGLPGEKVIADPHGSAGGIPVLKIKDIIEASPARRQEPCRYANVCGGCDWLHVQPDFQLEFKKDIFLDCLKRIGKIEYSGPIDIFQSPENNYRIRAQIKVDKSGKAGYYKKQSNEIIDINECPLLSEKINALFDVLRKSHGKDISNIKVLAGDSDIASSPVLPDITTSQTLIKFGSWSFRAGGDSFFQNNRYLLEKLGTWALPHLGEVNKFLDLYGGVGFFSVMMGKQAKNGLLVECIPEQVSFANSNFQDNNIGNVKAIPGTVEEMERKRAVKKGDFDLIIIDPPRPGLTQSARTWVGNMNSDKILYVSCNPSTQARDVSYFMNSCNYHITHAAVFNLYPCTHHLETMLLLKKN